MAHISLFFHELAIRLPIHGNCLRQIELTRVDGVVTNAGHSRPEKGCLLHRTLAIRDVLVKVPP